MSRWSSKRNTCLHSNDAFGTDITRSRLAHDSTPLKISATGNHPPFYIQKTLLAAVSKNLADYCVAHGSLKLEYEVLRMFMAWIIDRKVTKGSQKTLVQAWKFGARFKIPSFQNCVMRELVPCLLQQSIKPSVVWEAYSIGKIFAPLQEAFVRQLSSNILRDPDNTIWTHDEFRQSGLEKRGDFGRDLMVAMCVAARHKAADDRSRDEEADLEGLLVDE